VAWIRTALYNLIGTLRMFNRGELNGFS
jgi:hypothetical protein